MSVNNNFADIISHRQIYGSNFGLNQWIQKLEKLEDKSYHETDVVEKQLFGEDVQIAMSHGNTKNLASVKIGDQVLGMNGGSLTVTQLIKSDDEMYEILPTKGSSYFVNSDYILLLKASNYEMIFWDQTRKRFKVRWLQNYGIKEKTFSISLYGKDTSGSKISGSSSIDKRKKIVYQHCKQYLLDVKKLPGYIGYGDIIQIRAKYYAQMTPRIRNVFKGFSVGIDYVKQNVELDPYVLGYWLGDGTSAGTSITAAEEEVVKYFEYFAEENDLILKKERKYHYDVTSTNFGKKDRNFFRNSLIKYKLLNDKHIPLCYLQNSREVRLALLAGLVDSDGHLSIESNYYGFIFKSEKLADNVIYLARSLGFKAFKKKVRKTCTNSRERVTDIYYRFNVYGEGLEEIPSLLERKQAHIHQTKKNAQVTGIKIKKVGKKKCIGLIFDNNQKFLLADFTIGQNCH